MRIVSAAAVLALAVSSPALAQGRGTFELGGFGRYSVLDDGLPAYNVVGIGARVAYYLRTNLGVEVEHARTLAVLSAQKDTVLLNPFYARVAWHIPFRETWQLIAGAGVVRDRAALAGIGSFSNNGYTALGGLQREIGLRTAIRLDLVADAVLSNSGPPLNNARTGNISAQAGISYRLGKAAVKDADKDGVPDAIDACAGTVMGEVVDAKGCVAPKDADRDGVLDVNDRCPRSATASMVDASGCSPDSDRDGVLDLTDRCAGTPAGAQVDAGGCPVPVDADRDGVIDARDACAGTPAGTRVDTRGCPAAVDTDGDSVVDSADACPGTPPGTRIDARGCAMDADGDGVVDTADACLNTAAGTTVDARGCAVVFEPGRTTVVLKGVTFATGKAELTPDGLTVLDLMAASLVNAADVNVEVQGHTDNTGSREINVRLSTQRAEAVRNYLVSKGVPANRLTARGYGPDQPVSPNTTAAGRQENRRVELKRTN